MGNKVNDDTERAYEYGKTQGVNIYYQKVLDKLEPYKEQIWDDKHMLTIGWEEFVNIMRETTHE